MHIRAVVIYKDEHTETIEKPDWESLTNWMSQHWGEFDGIAASREEDEECLS